MEKLGSEELTSALNSQNRTLKCLQSCELQTETPTFTSSIFPIESTFHKHHFFCLTLIKVARICNDSFRAKIFKSSLDETIGVSCNDILEANNTKQICLTGKVEPNATLLLQNSQIVKFLYKYAKANLAVLNVLIKDPYYTLIKKDEQISVISFIGNAGGLMGLCMGLSLVSIFEMFYHVVNFILEKFQYFLYQHN
jgi:hypothetical protein